MAWVYLGLGSNTDRERYICAALDALAGQFGELQLSSVYESEAVGFEGDAFLNLVAGIETSMSVGELSRYLKALENQHGRQRNCPRYSGRTLDIDILTYDRCVGLVDGVVLPRGEILFNAFVLWPMAEIAPDELHPQVGLSYGDLWRNYERSCQVLCPVSFVWRGSELTHFPTRLAEGL